MDGLDRTLRLVVVVEHLARDEQLLTAVGNVGQIQHKLIYSREVVRAWVGYAPLDEALIERALERLANLSLVAVDLGAV